MQPNGVNLLYFRQRFVDRTEFVLKYLRSTTLGCKDIEIIKSEFVTQTQFLYIKNKDYGDKGLKGRKVEQRFLKLRLPSL